MAPLAWIGVHLLLFLLGHFLSTQCSCHVWGFAGFASICTRSQSLGHFHVRKNASNSVRIRSPVGTLLLSVIVTCLLAHLSDIICICPLAVQTLTGWQKETNRLWKVCPAEIFPILSNARSGVKPPSAVRDQSDAFCRDEFPLVSAVIIIYKNGGRS